MQNKTTYRLFEDKVDKLVHDRFTDAVWPESTMEWDSLQKRLMDFQQKNKTKKYRIFGWGLGLLLLSGTALWVTLKNPAKNNAKTIAAALPNSTIQAEQQNSSNFSNGSTTPITTKETPALAQTAGVLAEKTAIQKEAITSNSSAYLPSTRASTSSPKNFSSPSKNFSPNYSPSRQNLKKIQSNNISFRNKNNQQTEFAEPQKETVIPATEAAERETLTNTPDAEFKLHQTNAEKNTALNTDDINETTDKEQTSTTIKASVPKKKKAKRDRFIPEHNFNTQKQWYVEAFSGFQNSTKNKNSFAAFLAPAGYTTKRLEQENSLNSIQAGVQFKMRKNHLLLSSGLNYLQFGDKVGYDSSASGTIALQANGSTNFTYLEIPFTAGYEWANKKWGFSVQGGISAGILMSLSGQYVSINNFTNTLYDVQSNKNSFKKSVFNIIVNPQINYYLNNKMNIFAAPVYRRNLQPITVPNADLQQRYSSIGIQIGIRTRL